ncbi:3-hydroxyisobutyrate dehydrogenase [Streptomyces viridiviolaceus]|uniref:NAD(P)-dependent oxidoreductase n=1 Tax=Streptomyces viridiviolaceus TaxID=68282 RepID=A0ABW2ED16_9ACTN|nr:NAD(P)-binding domain-containing protein [Streptomyces viridiviolaceus]GHB76430.1 3-hydroxyisobutyrate dehydrogenase [Streptomyces viridiviolaceus]
MTSAPQPVTVLGLGNMGSALAAALLDRGHPVTVWNRTPQKAAPLTDRGARLAATPAEAIAASPLVIPCVLDYDTLYALLDGGTDSLSGRAVVNLTSGSPEQAHEALAWFRSHGADYLDGAIMTTPPGVGNPEVMFLYSGPREVFDAHRATLAALGDPLYLAADPGLASLYDAALLGLMWSTMTGWLHGAALVGAEKVTATAFTPVAIRWLSTVNSFLTRYAEQVDAARYPGDDATVDVQIATIDHLIHAAAARGLDTALPALLKSTMERAKAAGHGSDSFASVIEVLAETAPES